jgi:hypothetical protein
MQNSIIQVSGQLGKNDITQGQANSISEPPDKEKMLMNYLSRHWAIALATNGNAKQKGLPEVQ